MSYSNASRKPMDDCSRFSHSMDPLVDGELDPGHTMDVESHVSACSPCAERVALAQATRLSLKRTCALRAPDALRARLGGAMARERENAAEISAAQAVISPKLIRLRYAMGFAAAAGVVFAMAMSRYKSPATATGTLPTSTSAVVADQSFDLLDDLVSLHANPLPPETTNPDTLSNWDPFVGVPVRRPSFQPFEARFNGARVLAIPAGDRRAAMLQYTVHGGHRVTVYVFNPRTVPVEAMRLDRRLVGQRSVYVGSLRGYSVAAAKHSGVGYAIASDLDPDESAKMVLAALNP
jgi:anti-sigma factor (TIGR02949 family)